MSATVLFLEERLRTRIELVLHDPGGQLVPLVDALAIDREAILGVLVLALLQILQAAQVSRGLGEELKIPHALKSSRVISAK